MAKLESNAKKVECKLMNSNWFELSTADIFETEKYVKFLQEIGFKIINCDGDYYIKINSLEDLAKLQQAVDNLSQDLGLQQWGLIIDFNDTIYKTNKSIKIYNDWVE